MPSASGFTNARRIAAESKNTKAMYPGGVAHTTPRLQAACGLNTSYQYINYVELCKKPSAMVIPPVIPPVILVTLKWTYTTGGPVRSSPAIGGDGTIYVGSDDANLYAINPDEGSLTWRYTTSGPVRSSPAVRGDGVICVGSDDTNLRAIDPTGYQIWSYPTGYSMRTTPAFGPQDTVYFSVDNSFLFLYANGQIYGGSFSTSGILTSPTTQSGVIWLGSDNGQLYSLANDEYGSLRWSYQTGGPIYSRPTIGSGGAAYVGSDDFKLYAVDFYGELLWSYTTGGAIRSSPAIGSDGTVYVGSDDFKLHAIDPATGLAKWTYTTGGVVRSSPAVGADGTIYVGSDDTNIYAINPDGTLKWSYATGGAIGSSPVIGSDGTVYVGSDDGNIYALVSGS